MKTSDAGNNRPFGIGFWSETVLAIAIVALLARVAYNFYLYGYLIQPFFFEPSDTFMDWFNTAYWARDPGGYDSWRTIYPPLTFVVLRLFGIDSCYASNEGLPSRDCDWLGIATIFTFFAVNCVLIFLTMWKIDRRTAIQRTIALATGMPMLFALERGNVLLLTFTCFLLAMSPLLASARLKWLFAGLAINFKVYLVAPFAVLILKRKWRWVEGVALATLAVYLISFAIYGAGSPREILSNISDYSGGFIASQVTDIWYSVTYQPLISLLSGQVFPVSRLIGSDLPEAGTFILPLLVRTGQVSLIVALVAAYLRPEAVAPFRLAALGACLALITSEAGGYTQIIVILLVFMERWRGVARPFAIVLCYILCLPGDITVGAVPTLYRESWLAGRDVIVDMGIGLGMFIRPGLLILIGITIALSTIADVWRDISGQGMRERWRYRSDAALMPGVDKPEKTPGNLDHKSAYRTVS